MQKERSPSPWAILRLHQCHGSEMVSPSVHVLLMLKITVLMELPELWLHTGLPRCSISDDIHQVIPVGRPADICQWIPVCNLADIPHSCYQLAGWPNAVEGFSLWSWPLVTPWAHSAAHPNLNTIHMLLCQIIFVLDWQVLLYIITFSLVKSTASLHSLIQTHFKK